MASKETLQAAIKLINSELKMQMVNAVNELQNFDNELRSGTKAAGPRARKASNEWSKAVTNRFKEMREAKKLLAQYRKETITESKG